MTDLVRESVTHRGQPAVTADRLVLSIFPGIDLFGRPFEERGFCVVRGPDLIYGGDVRTFRVPSGCFAGVIGGPPCQEFSGANRSEPTGYGEEMLDEYARIVFEAQPDWWLMENVARVPDVRIDGYSWQRFPLDLGWFTDCGRLRHFQFGSRRGLMLDPPIATRRPDLQPAALASDDRSFAQLLHLQGMPPDFDLESFTVEGKKRAVGNGVPIPLGRVLAGLIDRDIYGVTQLESFSVTEPAPLGVTDLDAIAVTRPGANAVTCACGCGRSLIGRAQYAGPACRKRAQRRRIVS